MWTWNVLTTSKETVIREVLTDTLVVLQHTHEAHPHAVHLKHVTCQVNFNKAETIFNLKFLRQWASTMIFMNQKLRNVIWQSCAISSEKMQLHGNIAWYQGVCVMEDKTCDWDFSRKFQCLDSAVQNVDIVPLGYTYSHSRITGDIQRDNAKI